MQSQRDTSPGTPAGVLTSARGQRVGRYEIVALLSSGGMAELFLAVTSGRGGFRKHVVLKRILPDVRSQEEFVNMFLDEARITAALSHPNIAQVFELGDEGEELHLTMEFIAGQDLNQVANACARRRMYLPLGFSCRVVRDLCQALHYAHTFTDSAGRPLPIIHRDVAQKNVMVTYEGVTKLLDFGVAKARGQLVRTHAGMVKGTTGYMSPEQVRGQQLDGRSDVFGAGVVLYELLTGRRLFSGKTEIDEMKMILEAPIPRPHQIAPFIPEPLSQVIIRSLARDRADRWSNAREFGRALEQAAGALVMDQEQCSAFMRELFDEKLRATRVLLDDEVKTAEELNAALEIVRRDAGVGFPDLPTPPAPGAHAPLPTAPTPPSVEVSGIPVQTQPAFRPPGEDTQPPATGLAGNIPRAVPIAFALVVIALAGAAYFLYRWSRDAPAPPKDASAIPAWVQLPEPRPDPVESPAPQGTLIPVTTAPEASRDGGAHPPKAPAAGTGTLTLLTIPESQVFRGTKPLGKTPLFETSLPAGTHLLRLEGPDGTVRLLSAPIQKGKSTKFKVKLADLPAER